MNITKERFVSVVNSIVLCNEWLDKAHDIGIDFVNCEAIMGLIDTAIEWLIELTNDDPRYSIISDFIFEASEDSNGNYFPSIYYNLPDDEPDAPERVFEVRTVEDLYNALAGSYLR